MRRNAAHPKDLGAPGASAYVSIIDGDHPGCGYGTPGAARGVRVVRRRRLLPRTRTAVVLIPGALVMAVADSFYEASGRE
jgi:hypothetical protein